MAMTDTWDSPSLDQPIGADLPAIQRKFQALVKGDPSLVQKPPVGAKRLVEISSGNWQVQQYNGSTWSNIGKLKMDVDTVDGYDAAITPKANTIAVRNASGKLEGDITGNAVSADSAQTLSDVLETALGGTGATTSAQARTNLGVPPTSHASSGTAYGLGSNLNYGHVRGDGETTNVVAGEIVVKNVVINGSDSAQSRGQIGACYKISSEGVDFHTLTKSGRYWFTNDAIAASTNTPPTKRGGFCDVLGNEDANAYTKQIYHVYNSPIIYVTEHRGASSGWSEKWTKIINETDLATFSTPGIVKPGTGMTVDAAGALNVSLNNTVTSTSTTQAATANAVKAAYDKAVEADGKAGISKIFNSRLVLTASNSAWAPSVTGWARITVVGGGGAGGDGGIGSGETTSKYGGGQGGTSSFESISAEGGSGGGSGGIRGANYGTGGGGGGGAGEVVIKYVHLDTSAFYEITIGAGGAPSKGTTIAESSSADSGRNGVGPKAGYGGVSVRSAGGGADGASNGCTAGYASASGGNGGSGGRNGTGFGGGGGGGAGGSENPSRGYNGFGGRGADNAEDGERGERGRYGPGGAGGAGAIIIEYYDPAKEVA